ncbi:hypothetical protein BOTNAR_0002g00740 [Botryotinia narcissicola]|uniref:Uncharacterized protein n=1 Tax=Botryotinia narcissicola TaxID=278944 RepID=A0A4Z1J9H1_9HELO|nr:hypothetical protein BOTNAR_0002g00740 [Botryotinia narcissicola]
MATSNEPDPRFDGQVLAYKPESIIAAIETYYKALSKLPYVEESDIFSPPTSGWPNITESNFAPLEKTNAVIDLLKHLPYLRNPDKEKGYAIAFGTFPIDYTAAPFREPIDIQEAKNFKPDLAWPEDAVKSWVIPLTMSEDNYWGNWWLLDTTDGTVTDWAHNNSTEADVDYAPDDPRSWRNTCGETKTLEDLLAEWRNKFESLHWVAFADPTGREKVWNDEDIQRGEDTEHCEKLQAIIRKHGWPEDFKRQECKAALETWVEDYQT